MSSTIKLLRIAIATLLLPTILHAGNWSNWRGPNYNGSTGERNLPAEFSKTNNVKWIAELPGPSAATPIIHGDHVFVSSTDIKTRTLRAIALDRKTGKELWNHEVMQAFGHDGQSNYASPSPVTDGEMIYFYYGNGELAAFDFAGKKIWSRNIQKDYGQFAFQWTYGASPTLAEGKLFIPVLQRDVPVNGRGRKDGPNDSYLLALDPKTGKELWRHIRQTDARAESRESYTTPIPDTRDGKLQLLVAGGDCLTGHDPQTGEELWRWSTFNPGRAGHFRIVPSPVVSGNVILLCAPQRSPLYAIKAGGKGMLDDSALLWKSEGRELSSDVATPLLYEGRIYVLNGERQMLSRIDPATGKTDWVGDLGIRTKIECSPTGADGKIYFQNFRGEVFIIAAAAEFKILQTIPMGDDDDDKLRAAISVSQGNLFIRTGSKLYCVAK